MKTPYKKSKFNFFVPYNEKYIVFNSFSGAIGLFSKETYSRFCEDRLLEDEIKLCLKKQIIVSTDCDELKKLSCDRTLGVESSKVKLFRIWPTSFCNARCYYCFEKGIHFEKMTDDTISAVIHYIDSILGHGDELRIEWFGGEPLLEIEIIDKLSFALQKVCNKKQCTMSARMITNGSLINWNIANKIKNDWHVDSLQITLDGDAEQYNKVKHYFSCDKYNFEVVINAIEMLSQLNVGVTVRMNYDTKNHESLSSLIDYLYNRLGGYSTIKYYIYPIWSSTDKKAKDYFKSDVIADANLLALFKKLVSYKMTTIKKIVKLNYKRYACQAWNKNSYAILPNGNIAKCCEAYTNIIGNVWEGIIDWQTYEDWVDPNISTDCQNCKFLPICQGGCKASFYTDIPQCYPFVSIFDDILKWYISDLIEKGKSGTKLA